MKLRTHLVAAFAFGAVLGAGCRSEPTRKTETNENKPNESKPSETKPGEKTKGGGTGAQGDSFRLGDLETVVLNRGGSRAFQVSIVRTPGFTSEVKFSLRPPPGTKGITFAPADWQLNSNENGTTVTAKATPDASVGTFSWTLVVHPRVGKDFTRTLTVVVNP